MAAHGGGRRRRAQHGAHENEERWLLTYADMITLLLALFVVLFSISSVNVSKFRTLKLSLRDAFSGKVVGGGESVLASGTSATAKAPAAISAAILPGAPNIQVSQPNSQSTPARQEQDELQHLKARLDAYAASHGFQNRVESDVTRRGLVVRLLTDQVLFDSGEAVLKPRGMPLLAEVASLLAVDTSHPIVVEGHTDDVPIHTAQYTSNWELSTARATQVTRYLIGRGLDQSRFGAAGYADIHPLASNATAAGRARNRRVEVVLQRLYPTSSDAIAPDAAKGLTP